MVNSGSNGVLACMDAARESSSDLIRFGLFEVDRRSGELRRQGVKVKLQEQPFLLLQMLLEHPGDLVTREQLQKRIWPSDTFVDFEQGLNNAAKRLREALSDSADAPRFIETIPRRGYRFIGTMEVRSLKRMRSLAVLPLENLSRDPEEEYFAEGLTEALITTLAKIGEIRVVSRTSVMLYKGVRKPLNEIARELGVEAIVEGTVLRAGDRVRIAAQLIDAAKEAHLWAESYERDLRGVLALQAEVAQAIAREIQVKLTPDEKAQLERARPVDRHAYEAYLRGRYHWNKRTAAGIKNGLEYFQQAIEKDPTYSAAYAGVADCAAMAGWWGFASPEEGCGRAKRAALKALEIDDSIAEAHTSLGFAILHYDYDAPVAERELQCALELNPNYVLARAWYAVCLAARGRITEALTEGEEALRLDPLSLPISMGYAGFLWFAHQWDEEMKFSQRTLDLDPNFPGGHLFLARAYEGKGIHESAIDELRKALSLSPGAATFLRELGYVYARSGQRDAAIKVLEELEELSKKIYVSPYWRAQIYTALKEYDEAFRWLEAAYAERSALMAYLKVDPWLEDLHSDPHFQDLMRRMNFPP